MPSRKLLFAIIAVLYGILAWLCPPMQDDFMFMGDSFGVPVGWDKLALGWAEVTQHFSYDVGRLSNVLATVFLCLLPRWVYGAAMAAITYIALEYGYRLARLPERSPWCLAWPLLWSFALPWVAEMIVTDFCFNYLLPSSLIIFLLYRMFSVSHCRVSWWLLIVAVAAGWLHEQFSVSLCFGFLIVLLFYRSAVTRPRLILALAFVAGTVLCFAFPGIWVRESAMTTGLIPRFNFVFVAYTSMSYAAVVISALCWRRLDKERRIMVALLATAAIIATFIHWHVIVLRSTWVPQLFGSLCLIVCLPSLHLKLPFRLKAFAAWSVSLAIIASLVLSAIWMRKYRQEYQYVTDYVQRTGCDYIYYDPLKMPLTIDILTGFRVPHKQFSYMGSLSFFGLYHCEGKHFGVIPTDLSGRVVSDAPETSPGSGLRYVNGHLVADPALVQPCFDSDLYYVKVRYADGTWVGRDVVLSLFDDAEGRQWCHIRIFRQYRDDTQPVTSLSTEL